MKRSPKTKSACLKPKDCSSSWSILHPHGISKAADALICTEAALSHSTTLQHSSGRENHNEWATSGPITGQRTILVHQRMAAIETAHSAQQGLVAGDLTDCLPAVVRASLKRHAPVH